MKDNRDNLGLDSPYLESRNNRFNIPYIGMGTTQNKSNWCPSNVCKVRMVLTKDAGLICPSCGIIITKEQQQQQQDRAKLDLKQNDGPNTPMVISQKRKKRRSYSIDQNEGLTDEDRSDLAAAGLVGADIKDYFA